MKMGANSLFQCLHGLTDVNNVVFLSIENYINYVGQFITVFVGEVLQGVEPPIISTCHTFLDTLCTVIFVFSN